VIVAVIAVLVMKVITDNIIDVVAVGYRIVPAVLAVYVIKIVVPARVSDGAAAWVLRAHRNTTLIDVPVVLSVEVPIMQVVCVISMLDRFVSTAIAMFVRV
jgi:hypothetical protein